MAQSIAPTPPTLPARLRAHAALLHADPPRFPAEEYARRARALADIAGAHGITHVLIYGADRAGSAVQWLTGWPVTREAAVLWTPDMTPVMFVQFHNHVPQARALSQGTDVRWGGPSTMERVVELLDARGVRRLGVVGPLRHGDAARLARDVDALVDLSGAYLRHRQVKSPAEISWLRAGAALSDAAIDALDAALTPGLTEYGIVDLIERAYVPHGGTTHIHYVGTTPMDAPQRCVPAQYPGPRRIEAGDVVTTEISAAFGGHPGQVLRTFTVDAEPTTLYRELHDVADAAFDAVVATLRDGATCEEVVAASGVIEDAGYTVCDDLLHGFGGGYLAPVLGTRSRPAGPVPDLVFRAGMTVVVQPNVTTPDGRAGVQTGELVLVTPTGAERLHDVARGVHVTGVASAVGGAPASGIEGPAVEPT